MPKYVYSCEVCDEIFEVYHGMQEEYSTCDLCGEKDFIYRIPQRTSIFQKSKTGQKVNESIKENRRILEEMKKETKGKDYD